MVNLVYLNFYKKMMLFHMKEYNEALEKKDKKLAALHLKEYENFEAAIKAVS